uniref:Putative 52k active chromatin boundary protein n=1 Tax=Corethrella appendiculata TaxID=1370023 RepID=U5EY87_9DIPT
MVGSRVYVGGLPYGVRERDLERFFKGYGRTRDILIKNGYGFVEFEDYRDADDAVYELNGKELLGERVTVEPARGTARGPGGRKEYYNDRYDSRRRYDRYENSSRSNSRYGPPLRTEYRLIVDNLSSRVSWQDLKDYMRQAGEVTYADAHKQKKNEGVVEFASLSDMKTAIEKLDDTELNGRRIRLIEDRGRNGGSRNGRGRSRSSRSSSRSRSRSRSRRRSHSRSHSRRSSRSRSRSKSKDGSKSPAKSDRSRSRSKSRDSKSKSKSRSRSIKRDSRSRSRSRSRSHSKRDSRSRSKHDSRSRSRSRSKSHHSRDEKSIEKSRSKSPANDNSPGRNESMDD